MLRNTDGGEGGHIFQKKCYEGVRFSVIRVTRGGWASNFPGKNSKINVKKVILKQFCFNF